ncbi:MAG: L-seryl-tRNA(Sec) selenium transferase [Deltaproteobacteria bacterium]|nr:L-seryl-tRNA(Sec) selenium transferase [Deltaproteobacteria bacterium]
MDRLSQLLRQLPAVDELLRHPRLAAARAPLPRSLVAAVVRRTLEGVRQRLKAAAPEDLPPRLDEEALFGELGQALEAAARPSLKRVINATGVIIHTNLGRSPLSTECIRPLMEAALHYTNLEYDLARGARGSRQDHLEGLLRELTGAEAALAVNNNAAAVLLALHTLARGKEVIISRGQLVEIGGSFRMPEIMEVSGAILREVGTTNKTHLHDYEQAITSETAMLLKVHPSNFRILGFTKEVPLPELVELGRRYGLVVVEDLGSGCLLDLSRHGIEKEPTVQETLKAGADLVLFSGDKLLGGPQAGLALGSRDAVGRMRANPLTRALRPDKLTLTVMEATLRLYLDEPKAVAAIPTLGMITRPVADLERQAQTLARKLRRRLGEWIEVKVVPSQAQVGGGSLPLASLPSRALALRVPPLAAHQLEARLRQAQPPVIARVEHDTVLLDLRTLLPEDQIELAAALGRLVAQMQGAGNIRE